MVSPPPLLNLLSPLILSTVVVWGQQTCPDKTEIITLKKNLFCGYDKSVRPVKKHVDPIYVKVKLWLKHFNFEEHSNILRLNTWTVWSWKDELLTWDPNAYRGLNEMTIDSDSLWTPDVTMHTSGEYGGAHHRMPSTNCVLSFNGDITCAPPTSYAALCSPDLTKWPFDVQDCTEEMTSWAHSGKQVDLNLQGSGVSLNGFSKVREWDLLKMKAKRYKIGFTNDSYQYLEFNLQLKRHSGSYAATIVIPALVLAVMTLLMFFLDPISPQRLNLGCMNVLAHCLYLQYLGIKIPSNGDSTPIILTFFRDSLLLVGMSLFATIILRGMLAAERAPPAWVSSAINWILESRPGQLFILSQLNPRGAAAASNEDGATLVDNASDKPKNNVWGFAAVLLDRACFVVFTITLFILLVGFVP